MADRDWRPFVYGGLASCAAEFGKRQIQLENVQDESNTNFCDMIMPGTFPIDTTKTRLQIQGQKQDKQFKKFKYSGMIDAFLKITKQEGFLALYAGIRPAVIRQATYGTIKFGTYYSLKRLCGQSEEDIIANVGCAVIAGIVSSSIANPTDVLKVRMQVLGAQTHSILGSFQEVYRLEGVSGLWRGVGPTAQRAAIIAAVELPVYDMCKHHLMGTFGNSVSNHFISSLLASLGSAVASTPVDVIRTRLMNQKKLKNVTDAKIYKGTTDCLMRTVRNEGLLALYKGFIPTWVRMGPWNIIFFLTYEQLKVLY